MFLAAMLLVPAAAAGAQTPARVHALPLEDAEDVRVLAVLGLAPFEREREIIRYTFRAMEFAAPGRFSGWRHIVVQLVPAPDGGRAKLVLATGRTTRNGTSRMVSRREEGISGPEYRSLRTQLVRHAADLDMREQEVSSDVMVCSHGPSARFDMKLGGETGMVLSRTAGCTYSAAAYEAGDFLLVAAERIFGAPIEGARPAR
ncbi:MAG TPA: hypothetical protein VEZ20_16680 [Allosphingosinicella sp.]|jgi:hypothetical protein|nr:hypothetical protein [Allosphingosinicella sp.]